jgi:hypothetical protein
VFEKCVVYWGGFNVTPHFDERLGGVAHRSADSDFADFVVEQ